MFQKGGERKLQKRFVYTGAVIMALILGATGGSALHALQANAATSTVNTTNTTDQKTQVDPSKGGHVGSNGVKETLLTGDPAEKVKAAALAEVSGGTIQRVETDAEGAAYEAHMTKADGSQVTVKLDSNFKVTGVETGGPGHR